MTNLFRIIRLFNAVAARPLLLLGEGLAATALLFLGKLSNYKKNPQKFNFLEISKLCYNVMLEELALKAKGFLFWKENFDGEGEIYFMRKAKIFFCSVFIFVSFIAYAQQAQFDKSQSYEKALKSEKAKDRLEAIYSLSSVSDPGSQAMLMEAYKVEKDAYLKIQILEALSVKNSTAASSFILDATQDANAEVKKAAWNSLNENAVSDPEILKKLRENFKKEKDKSVKDFALRAFCLDKSSSSVKEIYLFAVDSKEDKQLRLKAVDRLFSIKTKEALKALKDISLRKEKDLASYAEKKLKTK